MDHEGFSSVAWDTEDRDDHHNGLGRSNSDVLNSSLFSATDEEDSHHHHDSIGAAASSTILPAETSAWADEPLDDEVIDIHSSTSHVAALGSSSRHQYGHDLHDNNDDDDEEEEDEDSVSQRVHRSHAPGKAVKRDITRGMSNMSLSKTAEEQLNSVVPMEVSVVDAHREKEGSTDSFVSYQIKTKTSLPGFSAPTVSVRRRFQDFVWLHTTLGKEKAACILPSLPDKHRMGYVRGDRFGPEFIEKRRAALERFLRKIAAHPVLQKTECVRVFLDSHDWNSDVAQQNKKRPDESRLDTIGDVLLNAFAKIKKPEQQFVNMREEVEKLEENLQSLERLEQRILKRQEELEQDYREFGGAVAGLGNLETGITEPLHRFAHTVAGYAKVMNEMSSREDAEFLAQIHESLAYCGSVKALLKLRDQKQLDFEELSEFRQQQEAERARLLNNGRLGGAASIGGFFQQKMDEIKGVDQERAKEEKIKRVEARINDLRDAVEKANEESEAFSQETAKEYELFMVQKTQDLRKSLLDYTGGRVEFFSKGADLWNQIIPVLEAIHVDD
ncbi:intercellular trafficking and secretion [Actinomortierella ambigua]|uniref:Sorting nexin-4 n=1 Tax=Actinomortierella ambigua TaxID=1343610 RepID=A0A9P6Q7C2_9FUNG|nr:intercellular trafficking and secretion [Actinomortierella ambigua]KAG0261553.1 intercellular trafficking and secretion [Actinomortierella ambigua]